MLKSTLEGFEILQKFINAKIVLAKEVVFGSVDVKNGKIISIGEGKSPPIEGAVDLCGDYLLPGFVELHTDHVETHYAPRPGVRWDPIAAVLAHDAQIAASGITTVLDALRLGMDEDTRFGAKDMKIIADAIASAKNDNSLRADHFIHLRCEVSAPDLLQDFEIFSQNPLLRLVSLMDHTPGQRQFVSLEKHREYFQGKTGMSDIEYQDYVARNQARAGLHSRKNRKLISKKSMAKNIALASHDDATLKHVMEAVEDKITVAEFPTTLEAAKASKARGMKILMGSPNMINGGSHSGNVSALELAKNGCLDIFSSDYVPASLGQAIFMLSHEVAEIDLAKAVQMVSKTPAEMVGFNDRGEIAVGKRADLIHLKYEHGKCPVIRSVWRAGTRVI